MILTTAPLYYLSFIAVLMLQVVTYCRFFHVETSRSLHLNSACAQRRFSPVNITMRTVLAFSASLRQIWNFRLGYVTQIFNGEVNIGTQPHGGHTPGTSSRSPESECRSGVTKQGVTRGRESDRGRGKSLSGRRKERTVPAANFDCSEATEREATIGQVNRG